MSNRAADMPRTPLNLVDTRVLRPSETALALNLVGEMDLLRLKAIARLHARGLPPDVSWEDLLQEALTRILVGSRVRPEGVAMVAFVAGVMRSLRTEHRRRAHAKSRSRQPDEIGGETRDVREIELRDPAPGPDRALSAAQELATIERLFADDPLALQILTGLGEGLSAEQIRKVFRMSATDYESTRKRMRRCLLREGLTCQPK
jgi:DNA-directed RNA polymerase specialized sigma24 family protein